jgi:hypothetical protein
LFPRNVSNPVSRGCGLFFLNWWRVIELVNGLPVSARYEMPVLAVILVIVLTRWVTLGRLNVE